MQVDLTEMEIVLVKLDFQLAYRSTNIDEDFL